MNTLYIGVDFHPYSQVVAYISKDDGEIKYRSFDHSDKKSLRKFYKEAARDSIIGIEATGSTQWFEKMLNSMGHTLKTGNPRLIRRMALSYHKSDYRDAETILDLLVNGVFPEVEPRCEQSQLVLYLLRQRQSMVQQRTANANALQSFARRKGLKRFRIKLKRAKEMLLEASENETEEFMLRSRFKVYELLSEEITEAEAVLEKYAADDERVSLVETHSGIGLLTSLCLVHTLGDVSRFERPAQVASFVGFDPINKSSGEKKRIGEISKRGSRLMRFLLVQAVHTTKDKRIREFYTRVSRRRGMPIAKVAAARKLLINCYIMLRDEIDYQEFCRRGEVGLCE
ncbi:MAG: IS110 family transposase [Pyrinomonadaceae bacterium]